MGTKIHPTKHAIERFKQRVFPLLSLNTRDTYSDYNNLKHLICSVDCFEEEEDIRQTRNNNVIKMDVFLTIEDNPPIPLTYVINSKDNTILTLYTRGGWEVSIKSGKLLWRWLN